MTFCVHRNIKSVGEWEAAKDQGSLGCRPPKDEATYGVKGTAYTCK